MFHTETISLQHKPLINQVRASYHHTSESHSFGSLFLWQRDMGLSLFAEEDAFLVKCETRSPDCWYFPCGKPDTIEAFIRELLSSSDRLHFTYMREEDITFLQSRFPSVFTIVPADGDSEYLYDTQAYLSMEGSPYRRIRKDIAKLLKQHEVRVMPWNEDTSCDMESVLRMWHARFPGEDGLQDFGTSQLLLQYRSELDVTGVIVYVDNQPVSMAAGFPLCENCFDLAFSKCGIHMTGLPDYTRQALAKILPSQFTILNGEDDLGIPGLRKVKQLMRPVGQIHMYEAVVNP